MVANLSGTQLNGCGGVTTTFSISFTGDGNTHVFELEFVDAEFGGTLDVIPVTILGTADGAHAVELDSGGVIEGIDFGNRQAGTANQLPGDWNQDGGFNIADPIRLLNILFPGGGPLPALPCAGNGVSSDGNRQMLDHNGDGGLNIADPVGALNRLFGGGNVHALGESCTPIVGCADVCIR